MTKAIEVNFDGLVGNTHNYAGLSFGNVASSLHKGKASAPKRAALQGLEKMNALREIGLTQGILPPHMRPYLPYLREIGLGLESMSAHPNYVGTVNSASNMWVANAGTVSPSADTADGKVHFTPANLQSMLHRNIEVKQTSHALKSIFANEKHFAHHNALTGQIHGDEGAANHTRFCDAYGNAGVNFFVYGRSYFNDEPYPQVFPARQSREAFEAIARLHQLDADKTVFALQNPDMIDKGVFHNDVISVGNQNVLFTYEHAFHDKARVYDEIREKIEGAFHIVEVPADAVHVDDVVKTYLFNSQLIDTGEHMTLIAPKHCEENPSVKAYIDQMLADDNPINAVRYFDLKQSMANGGGPACLRLRVVLTDAELAALSGNVILTDALYADLVKWVNAHYRDELRPEELADPKLFAETKAALTELQDILALPNLYPELG